MTHLTYFIHENIEPAEVGDETIYLLIMQSYLDTEPTFNIYKVEVERLRDN